MAVPKLRFQEFDNDWNEVKTGDIFDNVADKGYTDKTVLTIVQGKGTVPRAESGRNMIFDEGSISNYKRVIHDDFIIHLRSFEGGLEKANEEGVISPAYTVLRPKDKVATQFLYDYFHTNKFINGVLAKAVEGIRDGRQISYNMFKWLKIPFPSYEEQKKIANFITTFDKRITAQQNIIADMEEIKKGLLQKIFSQEIRFKDDDGAEFPAWEKKKLGDIIIKFYAGQTPSRLIPEYFNGKIPWLTSGELNRGVVFDTKEHISDVAVMDTHLSKIPKGTFVIAIFGLEAKQVCGNCCILGVDATVSQACMCLFPDESKLNTMFFMQWYLYAGKMNAVKYCQGTKQQNYNVELLKKILIKVPCLEEQNKIASFLSTYDKKIEAEKKILADLQELKKGLLQQMFV